MRGPDHWGIAGSPISHSLTPRLFSLVGESLGIRPATKFFMEARTVEDFERGVEQLDGDVWLSCTAPLKHAPMERLGLEGPEGVNAVNQLMRADGVWSGTSTDGTGFISACRHIGIEPSGQVLRMKGGGSAARAIAASWSSEGGLILPEEGRRSLVSGPWDSAVVEGVEAGVSVDLDAPPGGGESAPLPAQRQVSISYGENARADDFAVVMVVSQHLEAWKSLFSPGSCDGLPSVGEILERLAS